MMKVVLAREGGLDLVDAAEVPIVKPIDQAT